MGNPVIVAIDLHRLEMAKGLFKEAVILFFEKRDAIAVHHLAHSAHEILNAKTGKSFLLENDYLTEMGRERLSLYYKKSKDFIGRTQKNIEDILSFDPKINEYLLLDCAVMLNDSIAPSFLFSKVYIIWCMAMYPELFIDSFISKVMDGEKYKLDPYNFDLIVAFLKP